MDSINLIEDINTTHEGGSLSTPPPDTSIFINDSDSSYTRYIELLDKYFKESIKSKFTSIFFK